MHSVLSPNDLNKDWRTWKLEDEQGPFKLQHCWNRPKYWEKSWRLEESCCYSDCCQKPSANVGVKNSQILFLLLQLLQLLQLLLIIIIIIIAVPMDHRVNIKERKKRDKYLEVARELKKNKTKEHESDGDTSCNWCTWNDAQRLGKEAGCVRNRSSSRDYPNYSIGKVGDNTERSPGNLKRLAVTQTPVKYHLLTLVWKMLRQ